MECEEVVTKVLWAISACVALAPVSGFAVTWVYKQGADEFTDERYSFAAGFAFDYKYNNDFVVSFECRQGEILFTINADTLINSKSKDFPFAYRVDKRESRSLTLSTYSNEGSGGYTPKNVHGIARDILGGSQMFVRAITWNNEYLEAKISLSGSDRAIKKVFKDCGQDIQGKMKNSSSSYTFNDFSSEFKKLNPGRQEEVMLEIEKLMKGK